MLKSEQISNFIYHFGKATWKLIPFIGPFVDELFYEQFKDQLKIKLNNLTEKDLNDLETRLPKINISELEEKIKFVHDDIKEFLTNSISKSFENIIDKQENVNLNLNEIKEYTVLIPNIIQIINEIKNNLGDETGLKTALNEIEKKRQAWVVRISSNQKKLLQNIPTDYVTEQNLWKLTKNVIPECGYKEFRFRLHELEWLGLVDRYWGNTWLYKRIN